MIRNAELADLDALVSLETTCFDSDRLSRRSFRYMLTRARAALLVEDESGTIQGYVLLLFHRGTSLARIYSIAVDDSARGRGVGRELVDAAEREAKAHGCAYVRLEIRPDNYASVGMFEGCGYRRFGMYRDYYEDHADALRYEKRLISAPVPSLAKVPYYQQTLEFTCGPTSLMMAMSALDKNIIPSRSLELRLWREATTIFMTSGHGGCGPFGLALSAFHRGFYVEVYVNDEGAILVDSVRSEEKKAVIRLVHDDFLEEIQHSDIRLTYERLTLEEMKAKFDAGGIPIILISSWRIYREKFPHWVVVTGYDERFVFCHDPYVDEEKGRTITDCIDMPILQEEFERMSRYGKNSQRAALVLFKHSSQSR